MWYELESYVDESTGESVTLVYRHGWNLTGCHFVQLLPMRDVSILRLIREEISRLRAA